MTMERILRRTAQNDKRAGEHSSPLRFVGNNLSVVPQNHIKIDGRAWKPAPTTGCRLGTPYSLPLRGRWLLPQGKDGGRETEKSLPQSNALHLTALPSRRGRKRRAIRESPLRFFIIHFSLFIHFRVVEVTAAPLPLCRCATFPLTGESHRPLRSHCFLCVGNRQCPFRNSQQILWREQAPALPYNHKRKPQIVILSKAKDLQ